MVWFLPIAPNLSRYCTNGFDYLWKWSNDDKYADCLANPGGLQWRCDNQFSKISARILDKDYVDSGVCNGASLESLPLSISYAGCVHPGGKLEKMRAYPNPTSGHFIIEIPWGDTPRIEESLIEVYDCHSNKVLSFSVAIFDAKKEVDLSNLQDGIYFVIWRNGKTLLAETQIHLIRN